MEYDGIFYGHLVHFTVFCYILWTFGIVRSNLVYFSRFGILYQEKSGNPVPESAEWNFIASAPESEDEEASVVAAEEDERQLRVAEQQRASHRKLLVPGLRAVFTGG
jgi:hypothetical protein